MASVVRTIPTGRNAPPIKCEPREGPAAAFISVACNVSGPLYVKLSLQSRHDRVAEVLRHLLQSQPGPQLSANRGQRGESTFSHHLSSASNWERGISAGSETSKKRVGESIATDFIRAETVHVERGRAAEWRQRLDGLFRTQPTRLDFFNHLYSISRSRSFNHFMAAVVILDAYCTCYDIDARAANGETSYSLITAALQP